MKHLLTLTLLTLTLASCKKDIIYDQFHDYTVDGISLGGLVPPLKLITNQTGPLLPGEKEKYRTGTWLVKDKYGNTGTFNELNLKYY